MTTATTAEVDDQGNYTDRRCPSCDLQTFGGPHRVICETCGAHACGECSVYDVARHRYVCDACSVEIAG